MKAMASTRGLGTQVPRPIPVKTPWKINQNIHNSFPHKHLTTNNRFLGAMTHVNDRFQLSL